MYERTVRILSRIFVITLLSTGCVLLLSAVVPGIQGIMRDVSRQNANDEADRARKMIDVLGGPANFIEYEKAQ